MTVINPNSISGITSITLPAGADNVLTIHSNDGTERFRIDSSGNIKVGTACTISPDGDVFFTGVTTATTFTGAHSGSGANLTDLPAAQVTGTLPAISGANLTNLTAGNLTGALPAISGANLTGIAATDNVRTGILDVAGIATFRSDVNIPNINGGQIAGRRNLLINGAMKINQRIQTGSLGYFNPVTGSIYTLDRWKVLNANSFDTDSAQVTQDSSGPAGFRNSIQMNIGNTETPSSNQVCGFQQKIEAQDCQGLKFGTSSAETTTLSFWVYSNKTGTYCIQVIHEDVSKYVLFEYTISASNTWEKKTITISGNTSNTITDDNGTGLNVIWVLCAGSGRHVSATSSWTSSGNALATSNQVNLWDNADNYFRMTGCQLEIGTTATEFEYRSFGDELSLCQRYYQRFQSGGDHHQLAAAGEGSSSCKVGVPLCVPLRAAPTVACGRPRWYRSSSVGYTGSTDTPTSANFNTTVFSPVINLLAGGHTSTNNEVGVWTPYNGNDLTFDSEL